ncbi:MAG: efflux RND transporter periplasmic adaptor subunit [Aureliella sp.]
MRTAMTLLVAVLTLPSLAARADDASRGWVFAGRTQAPASSAVRSRVSGHLVRIAVKEGDSVAKGDLLVEIDPRPYQIALDVARARVKVAEAKLKAAQILGASSQRLLDNKVIGPEELALKMAAVAEEEASLMVAKARAQRAELTLSWTRVTAPFDGRVMRISVTEGDLITADQTPIMTIMSNDELQVLFSVPESILLQLRRNGLAEPDKLAVTVGFTDEDEYPHAARLDVIDPVVDTETGTVRFRGTLPNSKGILSPGMTVRVHLAASK